MPVVVLIMFILIAGTGYRIIQPEYTWLESFYMAIITMGTVGYQEVHPPSAPARVWTIFVIIGGLAAVGVVLSLIGSMVIEGQLWRMFGRHELERKIAALSGHVVICGYGRTGSLVAEELARAGRNVVVIDSVPERAAVAAQTGLLFVLGDAQEDEALQAAGVERAEVLVAALPTDAENVFVALSARQANPSVRIIARAQLESSQDKLLKAGATRVVCPLTIGASRMVDVVLRPAVVDFVEVAHKGVELEMDQLELGPKSNLVGKTLEDLALPRRISVHVVAVRRADGRAVYQPLPELKLAAGDMLILVGQRGVAAAVQELQFETA